ncbi:MAG: hypothetical protein JNM31_13800 [Flavobacteriales bacterium]|nr:hypothetical protein [Flavobacteriales bacterium]
MCQNLLRPICAFILPSLCAFTLNAQFSGPESVEYDQAMDRYYVSNTTSHVILVLNTDLTTTPFASGLVNGPHGLELKGDTLFACSGGRIKGYLTSTGAEVFNLNLSASFLNGLTTDGTLLYATDFSAKRIYSIDPAANTFSTLVANTVFTPNGIVYDPLEDRLVVVAWGSNAPITEVDKVTGAMTNLINSGLTNLDGITIDCMGAFLVSSWSPARITRYMPDFSSAATVVSAGLSSPADIDWDPVNEKVCIPNSGNNTVLLAPLSCTSGVADNRAMPVVRAIPDPTPGPVRLSLQMERPEPFVVVDMRGTIAASGTLPPSGQLDISSLRPGPYVIHLTHLGVKVRVVKE